ncbi:hypothetical protein [Pseudonocardia acidicola]|uniref:Htaa protein n=1 Tax=Pseudonocardia acidicola TaxID=2724939 RepID=A0ABX1SN84_9PSEU|nr:hypothetical protein [Pseudonocardia acidicola]NMI01867.1 hypothetical protein [Pseudonocardia acidicola]
MSQGTEDVRLEASGQAHWGRHVPVDETTRTFCYEADSIVRVSFDTGETSHFRGFFAGMDVITEDGAVPQGHGYFRLTELESDGDGQSRAAAGAHELFGTLEWRQVDNRDTGVITVQRGTGRWSGATGTFDVGFPAFCAFDPAESYNTTEPIDTLFLLEGVGTLSR